MIRKHDGPFILPQNLHPLNTDAYIAPKFAASEAGLVRDRQLVSRRFVHRGSILG
jgi:hypothetical protein